MQNDSLDIPVRGIVFMLIAMCLAPGIDICGKLIADKFSVFQLTFARYAFHLIWMIPILIFTRTAIFRKPKRWDHQLIRGAMLSFTTLFFFLGIRDNPIPNVLSLVFPAPLIVTLLSPLVLGEPLGTRRIAAAVIGLFGVLIILSPASMDFQPSLLWGLAAGLTFAAYMLVSRLMRLNDSPLVTLYYTGLVGLLMMAPTLPAVWVTPTGTDWLYMIGMGFFAATAHYCIILAFRYGEASLVAPFQYFEMVTASLASLLIFGTFPSPMTWLGVAIIIGAGVYITWREHQLSQTK